MLPKVAAASILATAISFTVTGSMTPVLAEDDTPYRIVDGKVDFGTYNGYRRYHSACHVCHGPDGLGSSFAPSLVESLKTIDHGDFLSIVTIGKKGNLGGKDSVMPSFAENADVMKYIGDIYGYLKARSDGVLPRGRPKRLPKGK